MLAGHIGGAPVEELLMALVLVGPLLLYRLRR